MFCDEHGTLDYCPYCIQEDADNERVAELEKQKAELLQALENLVIAANNVGGEHVEGWACLIQSADRAEAAITKAKS